MIGSTSLFKKLLEAQANKMQASGYVSKNLLPGVGSKMAGKSSFSKVVLPEQGGNVSAKVPIGQPLVPTSIPNGLAVEESVTVHIDMTGLGLTLAKEQVILFDEGSYYRNMNGIASPFPANTVYIGSAANNMYTPWVSGLCGQVYVFAGVKVDVSVAAGAAASADLQFAEMLTHNVVTTRETISSQLELANFNDPANYDRATRIIPLTDRKSRIDRQTAWVLNVYHGIKVSLTFFPITYARD